MQQLPIFEFGQPILRKTAHKLSKSEIVSPQIQDLIINLKHTLLTKKLGVGLAAPQVGEDMAVSVIQVRPTKHRPKVEKFDQVIINPSYQGLGRKSSMWEGCISAGSGKAGLFAKVPRYKRVEAEFYDEKGRKRKEVYSGLVAQIFQHETDHLNGILFVDLVKDTKSYMTMKEYKRLITNKNN